MAELGALKQLLKRAKRGAEESLQAEASGLRVVFISVLEREVAALELKLERVKKEREAVKEEMEKRLEARKIVMGKGDKEKLEAR